MHSCTTGAACSTVTFQRSFHSDYDPEMSFPYWPQRTQLLIVDEADRLKTAGLVQVRDYFDRRDIGLILIGMLGFERQLARYPQLYSRIGFAHHYLPLDAKDLRPGAHPSTGTAWAWSSTRNTNRMSRR